MTRGIADHRQVKSRYTHHSLTHSHLSARFCKIHIGMKRICKTLHRTLALYMISHTWQGSVAGYTFQQTLELYLLDILNSEPAPRLFRVFEHISRGAYALLHHRRYCRVQTGLYPICKTTFLSLNTNYRRQHC